MFISAWVHDRGGGGGGLLGFGGAGGGGGGGRLFRFQVTGMIKGFFWV